MVTERPSLDPHVLHKIITLPLGLDRVAIPPSMNIPDRYQDRAIGEDATKSITDDCLGEPIYANGKQRAIEVNREMCDNDARF